MQIRFDSKSPDCKTPFGCLYVGQPCRLSLTLTEGEGVREVSLFLFDEAGFHLTLSLLPEGNRYTGAFLLPRAGLYFYHFGVKTDKTETNIYKMGDGTNENTGDLWQVSCLPPDFHTPRDFHGKIFYQIFPDRFYKKSLVGIKEKRRTFVLHESERDTPVYLPDREGIIRNNDFFGGNLAGITEKLPYLASLSVGVIYLNPIFEAASNHRYDTADYLKIDPLLGTEADFTALCERAHGLGMRVILDGVFSHTGADSRYFDKENRYGGGAYHNPDSPYRAWYRFGNYPHEYASWWGIDTLPAVDELCPSYLDFIIEGEDSVVAHWLRAGADGFRLDVADELPDEFIARLYRRVKEIKPEAIVIGEVWEDASNKISYGVRRKYFTGGELDGVMNYPFRHAILSFLRGETDAYAFRAAVMTVCENYPKDVLPCLMNSLSTHDTPRVLTLLANTPTPDTREGRANARLRKEEKALAKSRLYAALFLQFTLPGSPCIYYGDEAGLEGYEDPFNRRFYPWGEEDEEILSFHRTLARLRTENPALQRGDCHITAPDGDTLILRRSEGKDTLLCVLSRRAGTPLPPHGEILFSHGVTDTALNSYGFAILSPPCVLGEKEKSPI